MVAVGVDDSPDFSWDGRTLSPLQVVHRILSRGLSSPDRHTHMGAPSPGIFEEDCLRDTQRTNLHQITP
eukprot:1156385-Pelagomonas_calceolata.AAC.6